MSKLSVSIIYAKPKLMLHSEADGFVWLAYSLEALLRKKGSLYSITERSVPELIPVLGSQPADDVSHAPDGRLPLLSARPAVTPATLNRAATNFADW